MINLDWGNTNGKASLAGTLTFLTTNVFGTNVSVPYYTPVFSATNSLVIGTNTYLATNWTSLPVIVTNANFGSGDTAGKEAVNFTTYTSNGLIAEQWTGTVYTIFGQPTNWMAQVLLASTNNNGPGITTTYANYGFATGTNTAVFGQIVMGWSTPATNAFGAIYSNTLYLSDMLGQNPTNNIPVPTNGGYTASFGGEPGLPTYQMENFTVSRSPLGAGVAVTNGTLFNPYVLSGTNSPVTNVVLSAYSVQLIPTNGTPLAGQYQSITNTPGRVEIVADNTLNLNNTRVDAVGYVVLRARHFIGSTNASIAAPYTDLYLGSTNGSLTVANLTFPGVPRLVGYVDVCSMVWSNQVFLPYSDPATLAVSSNSYAPTNIFNGLYNVVMVDSHLTNSVSSLVENLVLTCTNAATNNIFIGTTNATNSDIYNVQQGVAFNTPNLTLEPSAQLNLLMSPPPDWEAQSPNLQSLTNFGVITCASGVGLFFMQDNPAYSGNPYPPFPPYQNFVNTNTVVAPGIVVAANYVQNSGTLFAFSGAVQIVAETAQLSGGGISAANSDIIIGCSNLLATNLSLAVGRSLSLSISNSVHAGTNVWTVHDGFNLLVSPASGDMRAVAVSDDADTNATVLNYWAAPDLGPAGFAAGNSCVLGELVLNGSPNSSFYFIGQNSQCGANPGVSNALYVDKLVLTNAAAATNSAGLANVTICSGMKIYFNTAYLNGTLATNVLNGANGGALVKATDSNPGKIFTVSPGGGVTPASIDLNVALAVTPGTAPAVGGAAGNTASAAVITWNTAPDATNYLYFKDSLSDTNWQILTNFVSGPQGGTVTVSDPANVGGRFYQVRLDVPQ
jgi:hypothetical protein